MATQILNTEKIEATQYAMEANVISIDYTPTAKEQEDLFNNDDSIILEF